MRYLATTTAAAANANLPLIGITNNHHGSPTTTGVRLATHRGTKLGGIPAKITMLEREVKSTNAPQNAPEAPSI